MSQIRSKDSKPEMTVRRFLHREGFRYKLHDKTLPGTPDIVLPKYKTVIFVHGCFFHGHKGCKYFTIPKTRTEWWLKKIKGNQKNDQLNKVKLNTLGWKVIVVWECELKANKMEQTLNGLVQGLQG